MLKKGKALLFSHGFAIHFEAAEKGDIIFFATPDTCCPAVMIIGTRAIFAFMIAPMPCPSPPAV
jgi:hypothetical protein